MSVELQERITLLTNVRDMPYYVDLLNRQSDRSCSSKAAKLRSLLEEIGIQLRHICCWFRWADTPLPEDLIARIPSDEAGHEYLEVFVPEVDRWVNVDPTWDVALKAANFPIAVWYGLSATELAVKPCVVFSPEQSAVMVKSNNTALPKNGAKIHKVYGPFLDGLNAWLERQRPKNRAVKLGALNA